MAQPSCCKPRSNGTSTGTNYQSISGNRVQFKHPKFSKSKVGDDGLQLVAGSSAHITPEDIQVVFSKCGDQLVKLKLNFVTFSYSYCTHGYSSQHADTLSESLQACQGPLEVLDLSCCNIDDVGIKKILSAILKNDNLKQQIKFINLSSNNIDNEETLEFIKDNFLMNCKNVRVILGGQSSGLVDSGRGPGPDLKDNLEYRFPGIVNKINSQNSSNTGIDPGLFDSCYCIIL